jgi:probable HAF family extracellular repeat protein
MKLASAHRIFVTGFLLALAAVILLGCGVTGSSNLLTHNQSASQRPGALYTVTDLGTLSGGPFSAPSWISNNGLIAGSAVAGDGSSHAALWVGGNLLDLGTPGLGGPNSGAYGVNALGLVGGSAETAGNDPNTENFCAFFTTHVCLPAMWQNGVMTPLPLLGGNNGFGGPVNARGEIAGAAETSTKDPGCAPYTQAHADNGTGPQVLDYEAVVWGPGPGQIRRLSPLPGDTVSAAFWNNDQGQVVGTSGNCANTYGSPFAAGPHAVLWDADGTVHDLGNLGGTASPDWLGVGNVAFAINNSGSVAGISALPGSNTGHPFLWTPATGMKDLGVLPGDFMGAGLGMNGTGTVVGASLDGPVTTGSPRAVIWQNGTITDLNTVVAADTTLYLLTAFDVNDAGQIVGIAFDPSSSEVHAFLASPIAGNGPAARGVMARANLPGNVSQFLRRHGLR